MFEKRVRQVADTVKQMARDIPRDGNAPVSLENGMRMGNGDMRGTATAGGADQFRRDDEMLFAELQQLVDEGKTWISNAAAAPLMPPSAQGSRWQTHLSAWLDPLPPAPVMPVRAEEPSWPNLSGWGQEQPSAQARDKGNAGPITRAALKRDNKASPPESGSQSGTPPGFGWGDLLPEPKD